jgi:alkanesulfonate monooxygenase SsuD/methylene tetrahydromethanopterin reductase-like flavin-dependent oxidoreductase (luciferase family)/predicted kinase
VEPAIPDPALVVLVGPSGSGKSSWAAGRYLPREIVSSDHLRTIVGSGEHDLDASADAFSLLDQIVAARAGRRLTVVVDTLGLDPRQRASYLERARRARLPAIAVLFDTDPATCRARNTSRDRPVPAAVLAAQIRRMRAVPAELAAQGFDLVVRVDGGDSAQSPSPPVRPRAGVRVPGAGRGGTEPEAGTLSRPSPPDTPLEFILQISRFDWGDDPRGWIREVTLAAAEAGFSGVALMDHLIQIPQVGRAWDPIPEPWVTLGLLAGLDTRLRLGTLVTPVTFRSPGVLAKTVATLDALSGGRAFCGIGAGWWDREHAAFGLKFPAASERLDDLEKAIETMRALWQPGTKSYDGQRVHLPETTCYPRPLSDVKVIVGGSGERRTLRIAARLADGCNLPADEEVLERKIAVLRQHCAAVGRDPADVAITVLDVPVIGRDREQVAALVERLRGRVSAAAFARRHHGGLAADHVARYRRLAALGVRTVFVALPDLAGPEDPGRLAPVISACG